MTDQTPVTELTEDEQQWVARLRAGTEQRERTRRRLRAAGKRVRIADAMRRAAVAEMGQCLRENRAAAAEHPAPSEYKVDMEQAADDTGLTRRTLSSAIGDTSQESDQDLAARHRDGGYDMEHGGYELHRRYPWLAGLWVAREALWRPVLQPRDGETLDDLLFGEPQTPPGDEILDQLYRDAVDAIAAADTHTEPGGRAWLRGMDFWPDGEPPLGGAAE